jgi:hypothetical protein
MKKIIGLLSILMCMLPTCVLADVASPDTPVIGTVNPVKIIIIVGIALALLVGAVIAIVLIKEK